jgi:hypothetical protein
MKKMKKMKKGPKGPQMSWLPLPPLYEKFGSETITETLVKKALATSQLIFKPKKPILSSQAGFCEE